MIYLQHMYVYEDNSSQLPTDRDSYPLKGEGLPSLLQGAPNNSDYQAKRHQTLPPVGVTDLYSWATPEQVDPQHQHTKEPFCLVSTWLRNLI